MQVDNTVIETTEAAPSTNGTPKRPTAAESLAKQNAADKAAKKAAPKAKATKKPAVKAKTKAAKKDDGRGIPARKPGEFRWTDKRIAIIKAMRKINAIGATNGRPAAYIAERAKAEGISEQDIKHYCYKDNDLVTAGYVKSTELEESRSLCYYLTPKGRDAILAK